MITNSEIKEAVTAVIGSKKQKVNRTEIFQIIQRILIRAGFYADGLGPISRTGRIDVHHRQMVLVSAETDGFKLLPLLPGQEIELLIDGVWTRARVQTAATGATKQRLDVADDVPVFGAYARVPMSLDGSTLPAFLSAGGDPDPGKIEGKKDEKKGDF